MSQTPWKIVISPYHDPYLNLAIENYLFRSCPHLNFLLLWRNHPCLVIGHYQLPWREVNMNAFRSSSIPLVRRQSGGGAVYHDLGNLNFSFLTSKEEFNKESNYQFLLNLLQRVGIEAQMTQRGDLLAGHFKFSGHAFKFIKERALHHGTLLISSNLNKLRRYLLNMGGASFPLATLQSRAIASRRSPVCNLRHLNPALTPQKLICKFAQLAKSQFQAEQHLLPQPLPREIWNYRSTIANSQWIWQEGPSFSLLTAQAHIEIQQGKILSWKWLNNSPSWEDLKQKLIGCEVKGYKLQIRSEHLTTEEKRILRKNGKPLKLS